MSDSKEFCIDLEVLDELEEDMGEEFVDFVRLFLNQTPLRLAQLGSSVEVNDPEGVRQAAHQIKSSAGYLGADPMMRLCARIEATARAGQLEGVREQYEQSLRMFDELASFLIAKVGEP